MDDGKRSDALDVVFECRMAYFILIKGGSLREGGLIIALGPEAGGFLLRVFFCFFSLFLSTSIFK